MKSRTKGLKLPSVKRIARTLSTLLSQAVEDDKLPVNPALRMGRYLRLGDELKPQIHPLTRAEVAHLVASARERFPRWHPWVLCALRTGMRLGELLALQWGDVDWHGGFLIVERNLVRGVLTSPKSHQRRRVDLWTQLAGVLQQWRRVQLTRWLKKGEDLPAGVFLSLEVRRSKSATSGMSSSGCSIGRSARWPSATSAVGWANSEPNGA